MLVVHPELAARKSLAEPRYGGKGGREG